MPSTPSKASSRATASDALSAVADGLNRVDLEDPSLEIPRAMTRNVLSAAIRLTSFEGPIHSIGYKCWTRENKFTSWSTVAVFGMVAPLMYFMPMISGPIFEISMNRPPETQLQRDVWDLFGTKVDPIPSWDIGFLKYFSLGLTALWFYVLQGAIRVNSRTQWAFRSVILCFYWGGGILGAELFRLRMLPTRWSLIDGGLDFSLGALTYFTVISDPLSSEDKWERRNARQSGKIDKYSRSILFASTYTVTARLGCCCIMNEEARWLYPWRLTWYSPADLVRLMMAVEGRRPLHRTNAVGLVGCVVSAAMGVFIFFNPQLFGDLLGVSRPWRDDDVSYEKGFVRFLGMMQFGRAWGSSNGYRLNNATFPASTILLRAFIAFMVIPLRMMDQLPQPLADYMIFSELGSAIFLYGFWIHDMKKQRRKTQRKRRHKLRTTITKRQEAFAPFA